MNNIVLLFGVLILLGSITLIVNPEYILGIFANYGETPGLHIFAIIVRIILGISLVIAAADSKYPMALQILGWLTLIVVLVLSAIGRERFKSLIKWSLGINPSIQRVMGVFGILFGSLLFHAVY